MTAATRERPILFSSPMVRAILDGRKTQTRRIVKPQPKHRAILADDNKWYDADCINPGVLMKCPCEAGMRLWVRETWAARIDIDPKRNVKKARHYTHYRADNDGFSPSDPMNWHDWGGKWRPSIFMPRSLSRITLEIESVGCELLDSITRDDAIAEGIRPLPGQSADDPSAWWEAAPGKHQGRNPLQSFRQLWIDINGVGSLLLNPWVWVISFRRMA